MSRTILIDADIVAFKATAATEGVWYFNGQGEEPAVAASLDDAIRKAEEYIEDIGNRLKASSVVVCLTDEVNFRTALFPAYKANRVGKRRPEHLTALKAHLAKTYQTYQRPGLEADDCMGILATHKSLIRGEKVMVSEDKDMQTVPALLFNPEKDREPRKVSETEAMRFHLVQTLTGDPTDGYPGCPGIGPKSPYVSRVKEAKTLREAWSAVVEGYKSKGRTEADALVQARLARILRAEDWDFTLKRPRLWRPPQ